MMTLLTKHELSKDRRDVVCGIFSEADTVLTGTDVSVVVVEGGPAPAWSTRNTVFLNGKQVEFVTMDGLVEATGLNYHEIGHIMYTPGQYDAPTMWARREGRFPAYNILEDQRLETFLTTLYPATIPYFTAIVVKWMMDPDKQETAWPLVHGRRYLSRKIRDGLAAKYKDQASMKEIAAIIDEYRLFVFPRDAERAVTLIERFHQLLTNLNDPYNHEADGSGNADHTYGDPTEGSGKQAKAADKAQEQTEQTDERDEKERKSEAKKEKGDKQEAKESKDSKAQQEESDEGESEEDGPSEDGNESEDSTDEFDDSSDGSDTSSEDGDTEDGEDTGSGTGDGFDDDSDDFADEGEGTEEGQGSAGEYGEDSDGEVQGDGIGSGDGQSNIDDALSEAWQGIEDDSSLKSHMDAIKRKVEKAKPDAIETLGYNYHKPWDVDSAALGASRKLSTALSRLSVEVDPGWDTHKDSGRLNIQRAVQGVNFDELFDQWREGNQLAMSMEVVILLDVSTSMRTQIMQATQTMWVLKRAFDKIDASVSVITYSDHAMYLYKREDQAQATKVRYTGVQGGTHAKDALHEALRLFHYSEKHVKYLFVVTDGGWADSGPSHIMIDLMNEHGIITTVVYLDPANNLSHLPDDFIYETFAHHARIFHTVNQIGDLVSIAKALITASSKIKTR